MINIIPDEPYFSTIVFSPGFEVVRILKCLFKSKLYIATTNGEKQPSLPLEVKALKSQV